MRRRTALFGIALEKVADEVREALRSHWTVGDAPRAEQRRWIESVAMESGIPFVNLLGPLRATGLTKYWLCLLPHDGHASPLGSTIAAGAAAERITSLAPCGRRFAEGAHGAR